MGRPISRLHLGRAVSLKEPDSCAPSPALSGNRGDCIRFVHDDVGGFSPLQGSASN